MIHQAQWTAQEPLERRSEPAIGHEIAANRSDARASAWTPMIFGGMAIAISLLVFILLFLKRWRGG